MTTKASKGRNLTRGQVRGGNLKKSVYLLWSFCLIFVAAQALAGVKPRVYDIRLLDNAPADLAQRQEYYQKIHALVALQGIVNRDEPRILYSFDRMSGYDDLDAWWLDKVSDLEAFDGVFDAENRSSIYDKNVVDFIAEYRAYVRGLVVWDPGQPATAMVASALAGQENLLPVTPAFYPGSLCRTLESAGFQVQRDLTKITPPTVTGSQKCDWYYWLLQNAFTKTNQWLSNLGAQTWTLTNQWQKYSVSGALDMDAQVAGVYFRLPQTATADIDAVSLHAFDALGGCFDANLDFEQNDQAGTFTGWRFYTYTPSAGSLAVITNAHRGQSAARMTRNSLDGDVVLDRWSTPLTVDGADHILSKIFLRAPSQSSLEVEVHYSLFDEDGTWIGDTASRTFDVDAQWQPYVYAAAIDTDAASFSPALRINGLGTVDVDDALTYALAPASAGILRNGGMEENNASDEVDGWRFFKASSVTGSMSIISQAHSGDSAVRLARSAGTGDMVLDTWDAPQRVEPNAFVQAQFYLRDASAQSTSVDVCFFEMGEGAEYIQNFASQTFTLSSSWQAYEIEGMASASADLVGVAFRFHGGSGQFDIDDVSMHMLQPAARNLIRNPGMEANNQSDQIDDWTLAVTSPGVGALQVTGSAYRAGYAARVVSQSTAGLVELSNSGAKFAIDPQSALSATFMMRDPNAASTQLRAKLVTLGVDGVTEVDEIGTTDFTATGQWENYRIEGVASQAAAYAQLSLMVLGQGTVDIDQACAQQSETRASRNILFNPDFEDNNGTDEAQDWRFYRANSSEGTLSITSSAHAGASAVQVTRTGTTGDVVLDTWDTPRPVASETLLAAEFYLRDPNNQSTQVTANFFELAASNQSFLGNLGTQTFTLTSDWKKYRIWGVTSAGAGFAGLALRVSGTGTFAIDDALMTQPVASHPNLLANGEMEFNNGTDQADHWRLFASPASEGSLQVIGDAARGQSAMRMTRTGSTGDVVFDNWNAPAPCLGLHPYKAVFYLRDPNAASTQVQAHLFQLDGSDQWVGDMGSQTFELTSQWRPYAIMGTALASAEQLGLALRVAGAGTVDIDRVELYELVNQEENLLRNGDLEGNNADDEIDDWRFYTAYDGQGTLAVSSSATSGQSAARVTRLQSSGDLVFDSWGDNLLNTQGLEALEAQFYLRDPNSASAQVEAAIFQLAGPPRNYDPRYVGYYADGYAMTDTGGDWDSTGLVNHDYLISRRGFLLDLSPWADEAPCDDPGQTVGSDYSTFCNFLDTLRSHAGSDMIHAFGFIPWFYKYSDFRSRGSHSVVDGEWESVAMLSARNIDLDDSDAAAHVSMANGSFWRHFHVDADTPMNPTGVKPQFIADNETNYVCWMMGDYDSSAWMTRWLPSLWDADTQRGEVPLGWMVNPSCFEQRAPHLLQFMKETQTGQDFFLAYEGYGYINPNEVPNLSLLTEQTQPLFDKYNYSMIGSMITGSSYWLDFDAIEQYRTFSPDGIVIYGGRFWGPRMAMYQGTPISTITYLTAFNEQSASTISNSILNNNSNNRFIIIHAIQVSPTLVSTVMANLNNNHSNQRYQIVDPYTMMNQMHQYLGELDNGNFDLYSDTGPLPGQWRGWGSHSGSNISGTGTSDLVNFNNYLKAIRSSTADGAVDSRNQPVAGSPGRFYRTYFSVKRNTTSSAFAEFEFLDGQGADQGNGLAENNHWGRFDLNLGDSDWHRYCLMGYMPTEATSVSVSLGAGAVGSVYFDDVRLHEVLGNMLPNGGLEWTDAQDFEFWRCYKAASDAATFTVLSGSDAYFGDHALRMTRLRSDVDAVFDNWDDAVPVLAGEHYRASLHMRDPNSNATQVEVHLFQYGAFGQWVADVGSQTFTLGNGWTQYSIPWQQIGSSTHYLGVAVRVVGTGSVDIDALSLEHTDIQYTPENLTINPGLEVNDGTSAVHAWRFFATDASKGNLTLTTQAAGGTWAARVTRLATGGDVVFDQWNNPIPVSPAFDYAASFSLRDPYANSQPVQVIISEFDQNKSYLRERSLSTFTAQSSWTTCTINDISPSSDAVYISIAFRTATAGSFEVDNIQLKAANENYRSLAPPRTSLLQDWSLYE